MYILIIALSKTAKQFQRERVPITKMHPQTIVSTIFPRLRITVGYNLLLFRLGLILNPEKYSYILSCSFVTPGRTLSRRASAALYQDF